MEDIKTTKLSKKYQITLPRNVRDFLGVGIHDEVAFYIDNGEIKMTSCKNLKVKINAKNVNKQIKVTKEGK